MSRTVESEANVMRVQLCIGDAWREGQGAEPLAVTSPATGERIATVEQGTREDVARAVDAAASALGSLFHMTAFERAGFGVGLRRPGFRSVRARPVLRVSGGARAAARGRAEPRARTLGRGVGAA